MLMLALPGAAYLYQGDELALPEVLDLPEQVRQDPIWVRSGGSELGRDGCRVPMPWTSQPTRFGFTDAPSAWLPQPALFGSLSVEAQEQRPWSALEVVRRAVRARKDLFTGDDVTWLDEPGDDVVAFRRGGTVCVLNTSTRELALPDDWGTVRVSSAPISGRILPTDACAWLSVADGDGVSPSPTPATAGTTKES
jgi:alpha-glucosidase